MRTSEATTTRLAFLYLEPEFTAMRHFKILAALLLASLPLAPLAAQTTGFPFVNDLTVNGSTPGSTSCNFVNSSSLPHTYQITSAPSSPCALIFSLCSCQGGAVPLFPSTCPFPMLQSIDLDPTCPIVVNLGATNAAGIYSITFPASSAPFRFSVQGVILHPCSSVLWTQAYDVFI